ncbi:hypothetical protein [Candidatus Protofrankia datiscae]|uniref:hypothetical protein n=1 Tax=Candidatus Protofrankia datiscae TaxID=2716812 RepID=UPI0002E900A0|nr:hypothetical protein [Candidatus Protofrankia datiscae]
MTLLPYGQRTSGSLSTEAGSLQWSRNGEITSAGYSYPEGYLTKDVGYIGADGRGVLRTEYLARVFAATASRGTGNGNAPRTS